MLIAPFAGPLAAALAAEARAAGWSVALATARRTARVPENAGGDQAGEDKAAEDRSGETEALAYNTGSYVSVAGLVLSARTALGEIDAAVLIADRGLGGLDLAAARPGDISVLIEECCSGPLYMARELMKRFEARKAGRIILLSTEPPRDAALGPVAALIDGAFDGLGRGLFAAAAGTAWAAYGVQDAGAQPERTARLVLGLLTDEKPTKSGRWIRFTGRTGIFGGA